MQQTQTKVDQRWIGFIFISLSLLVVTINDTILNVSLPTIAYELGASSSDLQWIQNAYILVFAALLLTMGTLSDRYGRKRFLMIGVAAFSFFSLIAGLSQQTSTLILARALQGIGGAIIMPSTLSMITVMFPKPRENARAIAIWSAMFGLGVGIGPILGGWLLDQAFLSWKSIFFVSIPFGMIALLGAAIFLPESRDPEAPPADIPGVFLSTTALFTLVFGIIKAGEIGWDQPRTLVSLALALILIALFLIWEKRAAHPMLPLHFFTNMSFTAASISMTVTLFTLLGIIFFIPQFFQGIQNYTPLETGILMIPQAVISILISLNSHHIVRLIGIKKSVTGGLLLGAAGFIYLSLILQAHTSYALILLGFIIIITGIDTALPAGTISIMGSIPKEKAGIGSAMSEMTGQIGAALGIAVLGAIINRTYLLRIQTLETNLSTQTMQQLQSSIFSAKSMLLESDLPDKLQLLANVQEGFIEGLRQAMLVGGILLIGTAILTAWLLPHKIEHIQTHTFTSRTPIPAAQQHTSAS